MDIKVALIQFYLRVALAHALTVIIESSTKTLANRFCLPSKDVK